MAIVRQHFAHRSHELNQLQNCRTEQVVLVPIALEHDEQALKEIVLHHISIVEFILDAYAHAHKADGNQPQECVLALQQAQHLRYDVVAQDKVLDSVAMRLNAEAQHLANMISGGRRRLICGRVQQVVSLLVGGAGIAAYIVDGHVAGSTFAPLRSRDSPTMVAAFTENGSKSHVM